MVPAVASILAALIGLLGVVVGVAITKERPNSKSADFVIDPRSQITADGEVYSVAGTGFRGDTSVWVTVDGKNGVSALVRPDDGRFAAQLTVSPLKDGRHEFVATGQQSGVRRVRYLDIAPAP
jgi:hypothetical protein